MPCATALGALAESAMMAVATPQTFGRMRMLKYPHLVRPRGDQRPVQRGGFSCIARQPGRRRLRGRFFPYFGIKSFSPGAVMSPSRAALEKPYTLFRSTSSRIIGGLRSVVLMAAGAKHADCA